ncbi:MULTISPECIES: helix-turn-helix transcriptional regulator [Devosia]|uniref:LexA repressor n=1 Tax=Devosia equisanguinis TaxID=2490941 RepID=A0A447I7T3_9HYPH|nr:MULTISPECIES: helix-turn-helix transcriptional regulator [Devosia]ODT47816.1 MAG: DNA-binding protein [Pelagibacterium sp. SCN 63-126]ODU87242.1 MAG: DNA-binding protein [Pelagibacterium sp. SCN 63-17]OJX42474.1 MAG: DNA-binding protein [Devosia sp. 63-57]VDS03546.1 LexA repressor [Devosia equisanguinis]
MLSHRAIWDGIDAMARRHGHSVSALARLAGLDATAFNVSKRVSKDGRERWPSTESIAKILEATGEGFDTFLSGTGAYMQTSGFAEPAQRTVPLLGLAQAGAGGFFDSAGFPVGQGWDEIVLPTPADNGIYALEVTGDSMEPLYREGDRIVVSPTEQVRRGDRVVVRTREGEVMAKILHRQTARQMELHSINPAYEPRVLDLADVEWVARIIWASQ